VKNTGENISGYEVYLCGPLPMIQAFEKKFMELGLFKDKIHYEEFNFR
jgi:ferredoxin-NADP reductase